MAVSKIVFSVPIALFASHFVGTGGARPASFRLVSGSNPHAQEFESSNQTIKERPKKPLDGTFVRKSGRHPGIMLSYVKAIAEAHGGMVEARNLPEGGVEFSVQFPAEMMVAPEG